MAKDKQGLDKNKHYVEKSKKKNSNIQAKQKSEDLPEKTLKYLKYLKYLRLILLAAVLVVVFYPPYFRGLYFEDEQLPTEIFVFVTFAVFWVYKAIKKDRRFLETPIDFASFGFVIIYFVSIFVAVGPRAAIAEWLKYCMYFAIFFMLSELVNSYKSKITVLWIIIASSSGVCILGIDGAAGMHVTKIFNSFFELLGLKMKFFGLFVDNRINSTLQYPNALASYLMAVFFISLGLAITSSKLWTRVIAGASGFILLITFVFTLSRGAFLLLPIAAVLFLFGLPRGSRVRGAAYALISIIPVILISIKLSSFMSGPSGNEMKIWICIFAGVALSSLLTVLMNYLVEFLEKVNWKVYFSLIAAVLIVFAISIFYMLNTSSPLELAHSAEEKEGWITAGKNIALKPDKEYKLLFDVNASDSGGKPYAYAVEILNKSEKNILFERKEWIASFSGKATQGIEKKAITFKVPHDSKMINILFTNYYQGTKAVFYNPKIIDPISGKILKNITLKYKYLPDIISSRFDDIQATRSGIERGIFYKDGLKIIRGHWLLGAGGGAWPLQYFSYQSYLYWTTQAHNYFLQIAVECGIVGVIILALLLLSILFLFLIEYRTKRDDDVKEKILHSAIFTAIIAMLMHSVIDFDLSLSAVFLLLWQLIGLFNMRYRNNVNQDSMEYEKKFIDKLPAKLHNLRNLKRVTLSPVIGLAAALVIMLLPILFLSAVVYAKDASRALEKNDRNSAIRYMKSAASADPFMPQYKIDYANLLIGNKDISQKDINDANKQIESAENFSRFSPDQSAGIGAYYLATGNIERGLKFVDHANLLRPLRPEEWQQRIDAYMQVVIFYFNKRDYTGALAYIDKTQDIINEAGEINKKNMNPFIFNVMTDEMLEKMKYIKDNIKTQNVIDISKIMFYNISGMDINSDGVPDQWAADNMQIIKFEYGNGVMKTVNTVADSIEYIHSRALNLLPGKTYRVEVEFSASPRVNAIPFLVTGIDGKNEGLRLSGNVYTADISTSQDFKGDNNVLKLGVIGKYEIKAVRIMEK